jgi:Ni,Fe-hydrogenase III small subunit
MATLLFDGLLHSPLTETGPLADPSASAELAALAERLGHASRRRLGRSLSIRQIDAGSCNACELEINALSNSYYDLERFGLRFVASPRHADVLLVTGPVTRNMQEALERTFQATPSPKWVVAAGDCAGGCGMFSDSYACVGSVAKVIPVDIHIAGCPPTPLQLLSGLLSLLDSNGRKARRSVPAASAAHDHHHFEE